MSDENTAAVDVSAEEAQDNVNVDQLAELIKVLGENHPVVKAMFDALTKAKAGKELELAVKADVQAIDWHDEILEIVVIRDNVKITGVRDGDGLTFTSGANVKTLPASGNSKRWVARRHVLVIDGERSETFTSQPEFLEFVADKLGIDKPESKKSAPVWIPTVALDKGYSARRAKETDGAGRNVAVYYLDKVS